MFSYWHHGVLMPDDSVIHLFATRWTGPRAQSLSSAGGHPQASASAISLMITTGNSTPFQSGIVERTSLSEFSGGKTVDVAEYDSTLSAGELISGAESNLGPCSYNLLFYNCETFARWCVNGFGFCDQILSPVLLGCGVCLPEPFGMVSTSVFLQTRTVNGRFRVLKSSKIC